MLKFKYFNTCLPPFSPENVTSTCIIDKKFLLVIANDEREPFKVEYKKTQSEHLVILTSYEAVHSTDVSENYPLVGIEVGNYHSLMRKLTCQLTELAE